jgi:hypothetical protein
VPRWQQVQCTDASCKTTLLFARQPFRDALRMIITTCLTIQSRSAVIQAALRLRQLALGVKNVAVLEGA